MQPVPRDDLVFIDETGASIALTRLYARAPRGERAYGSVPRNYGTRTTLIAALTTAGLGPAMTLPGAVDGEAFRVYVEQLLCPSLRPGHVVVMDNLSVHKGATIRELIEAAHCELVFLPSYSPDFSPIELCYSKVKGSLRAAAARTQPALDEAISAAIDTVTAEDARGWFTHCGYPSHCST
jgi:transposase